MDPHSMMALAASRSDDMLRDAQEFRRTRLARQAREEARSTPRPESRPATARRLGIAG